MVPKPTYLRNNIFQGQVDFMQPFEQTCLIYQETFPSDPFDADYSLINDVKEDLCPGAHDRCNVPSGLASTAVDSFDAHLQPGSPAIGGALASVAPADDFDGRARDTQPDLGAYEFGAGPPLSTATATPTRTAMPTPTMTATSPPERSYLPFVTGVHETPAAPNAVLR